MKINEIKIHNIRSIKDTSISLNDFSLLVGENNAGKTNIITALRLFYEEGGLKYSKDRDFPKFQTEDNESWIEISFSVTDEEKASLKEEYKTEENIFKVRRYFQSETEGIVDTKQSNIYAYENGALSKNLFYGAKNVSSAKLGSVIYIPELSKTSDTLKLSGPSPLREIANFVFKKAVLKSSAYSDLGKAIDSFNKEFSQESTTDDFSLNGLVKDINKQIENWEITFGFRIGTLKPEDIVKNLLSHYVTDKHLKDSEVDVDNLGQGLQRHIIYTLIRLAAKYVEKKEPKKKDFSPDFTLILFEEPESFLHPTQQELLNLSLRDISSANQVLITTHSTTFVSRNIEDITSLIKVCKEKGVTTTRQIDTTSLQNILQSNTGLYKKFCDLLSDSSTSESIKKQIKQKHLGDSTPDIEQKLNEESFHYALWLDGERSSLFFAKYVILCEGASEKALLDYLLNTKWLDIKKRQIYILDSLGKFNLHRYMNFLTGLGIKHSVLYDGDGNKEYQKVVNDYIDSIKSQFAIKIDSFEDDLEGFLGVEKPVRNDQKPVNLLIQLKDKKIADDKIQLLKSKIEALLMEKGKEEST